MCNVSLVHYHDLDWPEDAENPIIEVQYIDEVRELKKQGYHITKTVTHTAPDPKTNKPVPTVLEIHFHPQSKSALLEQEIWEYLYLAKDLISSFLKKKGGELFSKESLTSFYEEFLAERMGPDAYHHTASTGAATAEDFEKAQEEEDFDIKEWKETPPPSAEKAATPEPPTKEDIPAPPVEDTPEEPAPPVEGTTPEEPKPVKKKRGPYRKKKKQ
ncbi:MAG: hypothetical protein ACRBFS_24395 [Aureispira sp.]